MHFPAFSVIHVFCPRGARDQLVPFSLIFCVAVSWWNVTRRTGTGGPQPVNKVGLSGSMIGRSEGKAKSWMISAVLTNLEKFCLGKRAVVSRNVGGDNAKGRNSLRTNFLHEIVGE